jgi:hypothetical protein
VEKPLALSLAECDWLIESAARSTSKVVVGFNLRWHRLVQRAREFLNSGALGRIKAIRSAYTHDCTGETAPDWHRQLDLGGGVSFNEGVHHFDLWRYFTRSEVEQVFSYSVPSQYYEDETNAITARLSDGVLATGVFTFQTGSTVKSRFTASWPLVPLLYRFDGLGSSAFGYPGDLGDRLRRPPGGARPAGNPICTGRDFQATFDGLWSTSSTAFSTCHRSAHWKMGGEVCRWLWRPSSQNSGSPVV